MQKLKKRIAAAGLVVVMCVTMVLPVMAAGYPCPHCGSTNTTLDHEVTTSKYGYDDCIHGLGGQDRVLYRVHMPVVYCNVCKQLRQVDKDYYYDEEMSRICHTQRR